MPGNNISRRTRPLAITGFAGSLCRSSFLLWMLLSLKSSGIDYFFSGIFLLGTAAAAALPALLWSGISGFLADRLPKRYLILAAKFLTLPVIFLGAAATENVVDPASGYRVLAVMVLFCTLYAFITPAWEGLFPETFAEPELSRAYSRGIAASALGFISGVIVISCTMPGGKPLPFLLLAALLDIWAAVRIVPVISPVQAKRELAYPFKEVFRRGFKAFSHRPGLRASALGEVCFTGLGITALPLLILFSKYALQMDTPGSIALLLFAPGTGFALGCYSAGSVSRNKIEPGLIPLGALGVSLCILLLLFFPGSERLLTIRFPGGESAFISFYAGAWFFAAGAGFAAGILYVPLKSYILQRLRPEVRGSALSIKNASALMISSLAVMLTIAFSPAGSAGLPPLQNFAAVPYQVLLAAFAAVVLFFSAVAMWALPNFMLRFIILTVGHLIYRVRITGAENIPERGPALLLCNHVSAIDSILVSACTSRQIRFLLYDAYFSLPLLGFVARMTGFFKVPSGRKTKSLARVLQQIREHLANGGLICVFPEGKLTRNGLVGKFKQGYEKMLPEGVDIPIIPVNISFAWGSIFSNFFTRPGVRRKLGLPFHPAVTFGKPLPPGSSTFELRQQIIELGANAAKNALPGEVPLHYAAVKTARRLLWKKLFRDFGGKEYSAFSLVLDAVMISRYIRNHTTSGEKYVGVMLPDSTAAVKVLLAVMMADKIPVPLNYSTSQEVLDYSIDGAGIKLIITGREFRKKLRISPGNRAVDVEEIEENFSAIFRMLAGCGMLLLPTGEFMNMLSPLTAFDLEHDGVLLFSSGSTGKPKGVRLSHHNLNSNARSVAFGLTADESDLIVGNLPLFHSFGLNVCFWMPVLYGIPVAYTANPLDSAAVRGIISQLGATMLFATPSFLQKYLHRCTGEELESLRLIATGAEKLREDIAQKVRELTDNRLEVVECYGCTELSPVVSINLAADSAETGKKTGCQDSIGVPLENVSVRILDPLNFTPVEPGEEGIICVKGSLVMQGYLNDEAATAGVMAGEYYKTGDIARMDKDGYIHICGRLSRFSKIAGEMVPHEMVEKIINEMCASDNRVVAVGSIPDPGKGEALLVLYTPEMPFTPEEVVDQLRERSISNLWIPKARNFHPVEKLPLLGSGKLDLSLLRQIAEKIAASGE